MLYAERKIEAGEEIFISYANLYRLPMKEYKSELSFEYGIVCPPTCICCDNSTMAALDRLTDLNKSIEHNIRLQRFEVAFEDAVAALQFYAVLSPPWVQMDRMMYTHFELAIMTKANHSIAQSCIDKLYNWGKDMLHPRGCKIIAYKKWKYDFTNHRRYLELTRVIDDPGYEFTEYPPNSAEREFENRLNVLKAVHKIRRDQLGEH